MKIEISWQGNMKFKSKSEQNLTSMDAKNPIGEGTAMTPKELVAAGLGGCTAMDVVALFKKHKQTPDSFDVQVDVEMSKGGYPVVFTEAIISFKATGNIDKEIFIKAVQDSQNKYCGVSAMLSKALPIKYKVILNNELINEGQAHFNH